MACFHISGKVDCEIDKLTMCVTDGRISVATSFMIEVSILSIPVDFEFLNDFDSISAPEEQKGQVWGVYDRGKPSEQDSRNVWRNEKN